MATADRANTVPEILRSRVERSPSAVAFCYEIRGRWLEISWGEFWRRVQTYASALRAHGLVPGDHVGLLAPTSLEWELLHHAVLYAGGVVVGLEPHDTAERLRWIADHADLSILIAGNPELLGKVLPGQEARYKFLVLCSSAHYEPSRTNAAARESSDAADAAELATHAALILSLSELEATVAGSSAAPESIASPVASAPATLIYTSGTTGQPKGILYRHDQVAFAVRAIVNAYPSLPVGARFVCWLPLSSLFQRIMNLAATQSGGTVYLVSNPLAVLKALPTAQPDVFIGVPRFYEKLREGILQEIERKPNWVKWTIREAIRIGDRAARAKREGRDVSPIQHILSRIADVLVLRRLRSVMGGRIQFMVTGSAPTSMRILEFFDSIGLPLYEAYGMSENVIPMALNRRGTFKLGTVGKPLRENVLQLDEDGELLVKGAGVFTGYFKDSGHSSFTADGFYRTGDYASIDENGYLRLVGRKSDIIKTSTGRRISPVAIEALLQEVPIVDRAVVVGAGRKCLSAILALTSAPSSLFSIAQADKASLGRDANTLNDLAKFVADQAIAAVRSLAEYERPAGYLILCRAMSIEAGELTSNLKTKRRAVEEKFAIQLDALYDLIDRRTSSDAVILMAT